MPALQMDFRRMMRPTDFTLGGQQPWSQRQQWSQPQRQQQPWSRQSPSALAMTQRTQDPMITSLLASLPQQGGGPFGQGEGHGSDNTHGPENAGQPGSAGEGWGKTISDAAVGLIGGMIAPGLTFGPAVAAMRALTDPNYNPMDPGSMLGPAPATHPTDQMIANMGINPGAYGLSGMDPGTPSLSGQMTQDEPSKPGNVNTGDPLGFSTDASAGGDSGGLGEGSGGISGGSESSGFGGVMARGGRVKGPPPDVPGEDNVTISAQGGEHVMNRAAVRLIGRHKLDRINKMALSKKKEHRETVRRMFR